MRTLLVPINMKLFRFVICLAFLLDASVVIVSSNENFSSNITRGSSLSTSPNDTNCWISPSGNIAFGFFQLPSRPSSTCSNRYVVGIWFVKSSLQTLVWTANRNDLPLSKPSSVFLSNEGKFVLRIMPDDKDKPLIPDLQESVSYAKLLDSGNFVLYGSDSQIIWESFDHPTDTMLGGQKLKNGVELVSSISLFNRGSGKYKLSIRQTDGLVAIYKTIHLDEYKIETYRTSVVSNGFGDSVSSPVTLTLDMSGNFYLVNSDDELLRTFHQSKKQQQEEEENIAKVYIHRVTLDPKGHLRLYKERVDGNISSDNKKPSSTLIRLWPHRSNWMDAQHMVPLTVGISVVVACCALGRPKRDENVGTSGGDLELGRQ